MTTPDDVERALEALRSDPEFALIRESFIAMVREDLPEGFDLSRIEADPDGAIFLLVQMVVVAKRIGDQATLDRLGWFIAWCIDVENGVILPPPKPPGKPLLN